MTCAHGLAPDADCISCRLLEDPADRTFWGECAHEVSLAPWMDCEACEVREDDCDG